jgi:hypothetical protein
MIAALVVVAVAANASGVRRFVAMARSTRSRGDLTSTRPTILYGSDTHTQPPPGSAREPA